MSLMLEIHDSSKCILELPSTRSTWCRCLAFQECGCGLENNFHIERESTALAAFEGTPCAQFHAVSPLILKPRSVQHECYLEETDTK